jgi:sugar O-acyltransferase (sialic acid O-acetyltransferase NeuD family)
VMNYVLGGSGAGRSLIELASREKLRVDGVFDNRIAAGTLISSACCLGLLSAAKEYVSKESIFFSCIGSVKTIHRRFEMYKLLQIPFSCFSCLISSTTILETAIDSVGVGSVIFDQCFIGYEVKLGRFVIVNAQTYIGHESSIGQFSIIGPSVTIGGNSQIGHQVYIGANATIRDHVIIKDNIIIGCGANVTSDLIESGTYIGNPARLMH